MKIDLNNYTGLQGFEDLVFLAYKNALNQNLRHSALKLILECAIKEFDDNQSKYKKEALELGQKINKIKDQ